VALSTTEGVRRFVRKGVAGEKGNQMRRIGKEGTNREKQKKKRKGEKE